MTQSKTKLIDTLCAIDKSKTKEEMAVLVDDFYGKINNKEDVSTHYVTLKTKDIINYRKNKT